MSDPLATWWVHEVGVHRLVGSGSRGDVYDPPLDADPAPLVGFWNDGTKLISSDGGEQVTSTAQFAFPAGEAAVPAGSKVVPPARFGARLRKVVASALGDGGGMPTPDHYELALV